jgi:tetratricopeptide (TPR) repeat protein
VQMRTLGPENPTTLVSESNLAGILIREGQYAAAEKIASATLQTQVRTLGQGHPDTLDTLRNLGRAMAYSHRYEEASQLFRGVLEKLHDAADQENSWSAWYAFACVAAAASRPEDALQYLREAVHHGYHDADGLLADDDLKDLRRNPQFVQLIGALRTAPKQGT